MVDALKFTADVKPSIQYLNKIKVNVPKVLGQEMFTVADGVAKEIRREVERQGLIWHRRLLDSIEARKQTKKRSVVFMVKHGILLDGMRPHWVSLKRGRNITKWASDKGFDTSVTRSLFVRPHPFIASPMYRGIRKAKKKVMRKARQVVKNAKV